MYRADKFYGADRQVLASISLSFLPGAKIGVLGANGAGKSTLLRIMAGKEETSSGVAELAPGATVGLLEQEPELDPAKTVRENVEDGVRELRDLLDRFNVDLRELRRARRRLRFAARRAGGGAGSDRPPRRVGAGVPARPCDGRPPRPGRRAGREHAVGRRAPARRPLPAVALGAGSAAARRADEPSGRGIGLLAGALPRRLQGNRRRGHARSLLPRQRRRVDPRARPGPRHPLSGQLLGLARAEAGAPSSGGEDRICTPPHARARARMGASRAARAACQVEGASRRLREAARGRAEREARPRRDPHPARPPPRRRGHRREGRLEGLRRPPPVRGPRVLAAACGHRRRDRARMAQARRPCSA